MYPSEIRARILADQAQLRERLVLLRQLLRDDNIAGLRAACATLQEHMQRHIRMDDALLRPELADSDAWSALRVDRLEAQHDRQRGDMSEMHDLCLGEDATDEEVRALAHRVAAHLEEDFREQEKLMLSDDVLRDDVINLSRVS